MNIFILDQDPRKAAQLMCNQHINKMILESTQLLCTTYHVRMKGLRDWYTPDPMLYKPTHANHPCRLWLGDSMANCEWLWSHINQLAYEWEERFNKVEHASVQVAMRAMDMLEVSLTEDEFSEHIHKGQHTEFPQAMPESMKASEHWKAEGKWNEYVVEAYRYYYNYKNKSWQLEGKKPMTWTYLATKPEWME